MKIFKTALTLWEPKEFTWISFNLSFCFFQPNQSYIRYTQRVLHRANMPDYVSRPQTRIHVDRRHEKNPEMFGATLYRLLDELDAVAVRQWIGVSVRYWHCVSKKLHDNCAHNVEIFIPYLRPYLPWTFQSDHSAQGRGSFEYVVQALHPVHTRVQSHRKKGSGTVARAHWKISMICDFFVEYLLLNRSRGYFWPKSRGSSKITRNYGHFHK